ncbi:MAG: hypothetical protein ABFD20_04065 [Anaerolineales bacterium]
MQTSLPFVLATMATLLLPLVVRWFGLRVQRLILILTDSQDAALYVYHFVLLPGTLLHEFAHWLTAKLLGVRTGHLTLMPERKGNVARFGAVQIGASDPVRASVIGAAPFFVGLAAATAIARWRFGVTAAIPTSSAEASALWQALRAAPDAALWLYLILSVSNAMLPSASDRRSWHWVGLGLLVLIVALALLGYLDRVLAPALPWLTRIADAIGFVGLLTIAGDLTAGLLAILLERMVGAVSGRRVDVA